MRNSLTFRQSLAARALLVLLLLGPAFASGFSLGSPVCEVTSLPLVPMSATLASPPPSGWRLETTRSMFVPGRPVNVRVSHPDATKTALGVLIWAKRGVSEGAGSFQVDGGMYQYIPLPTECGQWAVSHTMPTPKTLDDLRFSWLPDGEGDVILRAFLIENCGMPGGCRSYQALTPIKALTSSLFFSGFETDD